MNPLNETIKRIEKHADSIYVREKVDGEWGSYALTELPTHLAIPHILRFVADAAERTIDEINTELEKVAL